MDSGFTTLPKEGRGQRDSGCVSVEDGEGRPGEEMQTRASRGGLMKIMRVSQDGGTQYGQRAGKTVLWFGSTAGDV